MDLWALILSRVVGRTAGGTVQTLVATEQDLVTEAVKHKIGIAAARAMLREMLRPDRRLLCLVGGEGGTLAYSLGHDSLGPSVLRRSAQAAVRAEAEAQLAKERAARALTEAQAEAQLAQEREKRAVAELTAEQQRVQSERLILEERYKTRLIVGLAAFVVFALGAAGVLYASIFVNPVRERIRAVTQFAEQDQTADLRQRLLLLATALRSGDHWPLSWFIDTNTPKRVIRNVLFRSPVFGGNFTAGAFAADGRRIVRLENDKLVVHDLTEGKDIKSYDLPIDSDERAASSSSPSVGLITREDGSEGVVGFRSASATVWIEQEDLTLKKGFMLPEKFQEPGEWNARAELFGNHARVIILRFDRSAIRGMSVLDLSGAVVSTINPKNY